MTIEIKEKKQAEQKRSWYDNGSRAHLLHHHSSSDENQSGHIQEDALRPSAPSNSQLWIPARRLKGDFSTGWCKLSYLSFNQNFFGQQKVLLLLDWPAKSPDLSPIENIWALMDRKITQNPAMTLEELREKTAAVWLEVCSAQTCRNLYESMKNRLQLWIGNPGARIRKWTSIQSIFCCSSCIFHIRELSSVYFLFLWSTIFWIFSLRYSNWEIS